MTHDLNSTGMYLTHILNDKKVKVRTAKVHAGELLFDYNGDFIGIYQGNGYILMTESMEDKNDA